MQILNCWRKTLKLIPFPDGKSVPAQTRSVTVDDVFYILSSGFLRGGIGGFLKTTTANSAQAGGSKEIRVGLAMVGDF